METPENEAFRDTIGTLDHIFYGCLWKNFLWLDMSADHFYGNGFSQDRILDRWR